MNNLERHMNDPDISNEAMPMREIHAIRLMIHEETKDMTPAEYTAYFRSTAQDMIDKYGLQAQQSDLNHTQNAV